ncbi:MAG: HEAT repeat domain-containing protein [Chloroflexia bacterium]
MATVAEMKAAQDVAGLIQALRDPAWEVRQRAAEALGELKAEAAIEPLLAARHDENSNVRWTAVWALGQIGGEQVKQTLIAALEDPLEDVRSAALRTLQTWDDPEVQAAIQRIFPVPKEPAIPLPRLLKIVTYVCIVLTVAWIVLSLIVGLRGRATWMVPLVLLLGALVAWLGGGRK